MAERIDHHRHTLKSKIGLHTVLLAGGVGILPVAKLLCATHAGAIFGAPLLAAGPVLIAYALFKMAHAYLEQHNEVKCPHCGQTHYVERGVHSFLCSSCGARVGALQQGYSKNRV